MRRVGLAIVRCGNISQLNAPGYLIIEDRQPDVDAEFSKKPFRWPLHLRG